MRYRCLVLDHDDTAVNSTPLLHYPAHLTVMEELRPGDKPISLDGWMLKNFSPGIMEYMVDELHFTPEEIAREYDIWQEYVAGRSAEFFPGFIDMIRGFHDRGGIITVVSHSTSDSVMEDYATAGADNLIQAVFGWNFDAEKRKPSPYPLRSIMEQFNLQADELLVIDDLKPAVTMAHAVGAAIGAAGWGIMVSEIADYMRRVCDYYFPTIDHLDRFLQQDAAV